MLRQTYNVDFGYICEVIRIVAAYVATIPITSYDGICNRSQHCNFGEAQAESSLMMVYVNRNVMEQLL